MPFDTKEIVRLVSKCFFCPVFDYANYL
jgi:hypothetical protein